MQTIWKFSALTPLLVSAFLLAGACDEAQPDQPPVVSGPDTTSHEWIFTVYDHLGGSLRDVCALSPDYVVIVGDGLTGTQIGTTARLWNGAALEEINFPIKPFGSYDTSTVKIPDINNRLHTYDAIWFLRRDHYWATWGSTTAHVTISPSPRNDTNVHHYYGYAGGPRRIWAIDSTNVFFLSFLGDAVTQWHSRTRSWNRYGFTFPPTQNENLARDLWGTGNDNIFAFTDYGVKRFDGTGWHTFWDVSMPSLCDSAYFGMPTNCWAASDEDSMWISGLFIGRMRKNGSGKVTYRFSGKSDNEASYAGAFVRGSAGNNIFFVGWDGYLAHYNGSTLRVFDQFRGQGMVFYRMAVFENEVFIVGAQHFNGGIFIHGRRR